MNSKNMLVGVASLAVLALVTSPVFAASKGKNGTTLAASKSLDVCVLPDGNWKFSGDISVWNEATVATKNLLITDWIQTKSGVGQFSNYVGAEVTPNTGIIQPGTTELNATIFPYSVVAAPFLMVSTSGTAPPSQLQTTQVRLAPPLGQTPKPPILGPVLRQLAPQNAGAHFHTGIGRPIQLGLQEVLYQPTCFISAG